MHRVGWKSSARTTGQISSPATASPPQLAMQSNAARKGSGHLMPKILGQRPTSPTPPSINRRAQIATGGISTCRKEARQPTSQSSSGPSRSCSSSRRGVAVSSQRQRRRNAGAVHRLVGVIGLVHVFVLFMLIQTLAVESGSPLQPGSDHGHGRDARRSSRSMPRSTSWSSSPAPWPVRCCTKALLLDERQGEAVNYGAAPSRDRIDGEHLGQA